MFVVVVGRGGGWKLSTEHFVVLGCYTELLLFQSVQVIESSFKLGVVNNEKSEFCVIKLYSFNQ